jgi:hypothetical protein
LRGEGGWRGRGQGSRGSGWCLARAFVTCTGTRVKI